MKDLFIPPTLVDAMGSALTSINDVSHLGIIVIIASEGLAPTVCTNFSPETVRIMYQWLLDQEDNYTLEKHGEPN